MDQDLKNMTLKQLEKLVTDLGQKKFTAGYIFNFIHSLDANSISEITPLSKIFREKLAQKGFGISSLKKVKELTDSDGTVKYLFESADSCQVEAVLLFDNERKTLCISTQVGCAMGCKFCATAKINLKRNLTAAEIVDQVNIAHTEHGKINNLVYMGMGEPLQNLDEVTRSVEIINHPKGKNIGIRHITVSTCGDIKGIRKLSCQILQPRLAVSLNAPNDNLRSKIMPINKKYPLASLMKEIKTYQKITNQRVTFEYVLIKNLNDSDTCANGLVQLLKGIKCNVNMIEYNPHKLCNYEPSGKHRIKTFRKILEDANIETTVRFRKGRNIKAACGQLGADMIK